MIIGRGVALCLRLRADLGGRRVARAAHFQFRNQNAWDKFDLKTVEAEWKPRIAAEWRRRVQDRPPKDPRPFYVLSMFPYPSGALHMGHVRVYSISDVMAHYYRFQGRHVLHPMGWDAFGLPAENAARARHIQPKAWTQQNVTAMREQLVNLGLNFDWDRELATCHPGYYKWTQWIFTQLMKRGMAYQDESFVNWDPVDQTVLADEQVDENGCSWRSGAVVERRPLRQWFIRATQYSEALLKGLDDPTLKHWRDVVAMQRSWIGPCDGTRFRLPITPQSEGDAGHEISVWTPHPEFIFGAAFVAISQEHILAHKHKSDIVECRVGDQTVFHLPVKARNPFDATQEWPILIFEDMTQFHPDCQTLLGIPEICEHAQRVAQALNLPHPQVLYEDKDQVCLQSSGQFTGLSGSEAREAITSRARDHGWGGHWCSAQLNDWLISRQRYWGTPIPVIHCGQCGPVPVPDADLPVVLPDIDSLSTEGGSPLAHVEDWIRVPCPQCGSVDARRETDTMDTFVDSSWYFLRYLDPRNDSAICSPEAAKGLPVDLYIGGKEHATLHMYFARFITHFLHDIGISPVKEPFQKLIVQGMVKSKTYKSESGRYLPESEVDRSSEPFSERASGEVVVCEWDKMSKSKFNGVDPQGLIDKYGCDTVRLMMLGEAAPTAERLWSEDTFDTINQLQTRFLKLVCMAHSVHDEEYHSEVSQSQWQSHEERLVDSRNFNTSGTNFAYSVTTNLRFVVHKIQFLIKDLGTTPDVMKRDCPEFQRGLATAIILFTPMSPHLSAELWEGLRSVRIKSCQDFQWDKSVFQQEWPQMDADYKLKMVLELKDKKIGYVALAQEVLNNLTLESALVHARTSQAFQDHLGSMPFRSQFQLEPNHRAVLTLALDQSQMSAAELKEMREKAKEVKKLKKAKREQKIQELKEIEAKKNIVTTKP